MLDTRLTQVKEIFAAACLEPPSERFAFLARECGADDAMRREIESLLAFHDETPAEAPHRPRVGAGPRRYRRGQVLAGRYRIERPLGAGGMGEVYAVYDGMLRETVALKILHRTDPLLRRRLAEEVRLARQVTHPAVCRVYDMGDDAGTPFLTMELIEGEDLASRLERSGPLPSAEVIDIAQRLAAALAAAHEIGVLHRDLKPSNILVARKGGLCITDFGIATGGARTHESPHDRAAGLLGTPAYMAPEETERGGVVTERSDLYSLGLILYELVTGAVAFDASDLDTLLAMQRSSVPDPPSRVVPDVDPALEALILRLLAKDPANRPPSARAVLAALADESAAPIASSPVSRATERRHIITLVCGVEAPAQVMADREWPALVRIFQARATASCRLKGGRVDKHLDGGLVVHFGVPLASERDSESAVRAGLEIVADLQQRPLVAPERGRLTASVTVDALSASVRGNHVVASERVFGRAAGPEVTADRAPRGVSSSVTVGASMLPLLRGRFLVEPADLDDGERRFIVTGAQERLGLETSPARLTRLAGRQLELARLERAWRNAGEGRGQVVLLSGEAGLGKSRMLHELWLRVGSNGIGLEARCSSFHPSTPLHPFVRLVAHAARIENDDSGDARTKKLRGMLTALGARTDDLLPVFSAWLSAAPDASPLAPRGAASETDRRSFIAAFHEWIVALAETRTVLLVVEDVHWCDPTSREAIDGLIGLVRTARVLLVVTFRPSFTPTWKGTGIDHLTLQPLAPDEARALVAAIPRGVLGDAAAIVDRADGNPLFLEELALHEHEAGAISEADQVPRSLRGLLAARLGRLGSAKRIAQAAAVCGRTFSYQMLEALTGTEADVPGLDAGLARLLDAEILFQRGPLLRAGFTWKHALLREAAYESLSLRERRRLHALAALALPDLDPAAVASRPELLARHWTEAGRPDQAFGWWRQAGLRALERCAYVEARRDLESALDAVPRIASTPEQRRRRKLELRLALTSIEMGQHGPGSNEAGRSARRAEALCRGVVHGDDLVHALFLAVRVRLTRGELRPALRLAERLAALSDGIRDQYLRAAILAQSGNLFCCLGRLDRAATLLDRSVEIYALTTDRPAGWLTTDPMVNLYYARATIAWMRGCLTECRAQVDAGVAHADSLGHPFSQALMRVYCAPLALLAGDHAWFVELLSFGERQAAAVESGFLIRLAGLLLPLVEPALSPGERAQRMEAALRDSEQIGFRLCRSIALGELAALQARAGSKEQAVQTIDEAMVEATRRMDRSFLPEILRRRAELRASWGQEGEALADLRRSLREARRQGAFGLELRGALSLARLHAAGDRHEAARRALRSVVAHLPDEVDAPERAEAESLLRDPLR